MLKFAFAKRANFHRLRALSLPFCAEKFFTAPPLPGLRLGFAPLSLRCRSAPLRCAPPVLAGSKNLPTFADGCEMGRIVTICCVLYIVTLCQSVVFFGAMQPVNLAKPYFIAQVESRELEPM